jgi:hypothetical protein
MFGTCVLTGLAFGLIPAYRAVRSEINECLREGARSTATISRHRTRNSLVIVEVALSLVLLICAGLMINTLTRILSTSPGFNPEHLLSAEVRLTGDKYVDSTQQGDTGINTIRPAAAEFCRQLMERLQSIPSVEEVALIDWLPLVQDHQYASPSFTIAGRSAPAAHENRGCCGRRSVPIIFT